MVSFGENLKALRVAKNISQSELGDLINVHSTHISRYERSLTVPSIDVLRKIAEKLNVTTDELVFGKPDEKAKNNIKDNELLILFSKVQKLDKSEQNCVKSLLTSYVFHHELKHNI